MSSYKELVAQIEELQKKAEEVRKAEVQSVISDIKAKMAEFGLTTADLGMKGTEKPRKSTGHLPAKYRDPVSGACWSGRGREPRWLQEAVASGKSKESYLV